MMASSTWPERAIPSDDPHILHSNNPSTYAINSTVASADQSHLLLNQANSANSASSNISTKQNTTIDEQLLLLEKLLNGNTSTSQETLINQLHPMFERIHSLLSQLPESQQSQDNSSANQYKATLNKITAIVSRHPFAAALWPHEFFPLTEYYNYLQEKQNQQHLEKFLEMKSQQQKLSESLDNDDDDSEDANSPGIQQPVESSFEEKAAPVAAAPTENSVPHQVDSFPTISAKEEQRQEGRASARISHIPLNYFPGSAHSAKDNLPISELETLRNQYLGMKIIDKSNNEQLNVEGNYRSDWLFDVDLPVYSTKNCQKSHPYQPMRIKFELNTSNQIVWVRYR
jgi:hypothetical protein